MAQFSSKDVGWFAVGGLDLKGQLTDLSLKISAMLDANQGLGDAWPSHVNTNLYSAALTQNGFYNDAANSTNAAMVAGLGVAQVVSLGLGTAVGDPAYAFAGPFVATYDRISSIGKLHKANATYQVSGVVGDGRILKPQTTATGGFTGSSLDNGASSSAGGCGVVQIGYGLALGGYTSYTVKIQHSSDNSTWADLITFTTFTAYGAQYGAVTGTVNRYLRATAALVGSGTTPSIPVSVMFARF
jgi:hypothetical protein